jgi:hypothetical protein
MQAMSGFKTDGGQWSFADLSIKGAAERAEKKKAAQKEVAQRAAAQKQKKKEEGVLSSTSAGVGAAAPPIAPYESKIDGVETTYKVAACLPACPPERVTVL